MYIYCKKQKSPYSSLGSHAKHYQEEGTPRYCSQKFLAIQGWQNRFGLLMWSQTSRETQANPIMNFLHNAKHHHHHHPD